MKIAKKLQSSARTLNQSDSRSGNFIMLSREDGGEGARRCASRTLPRTQDQAIQTSLAASVRK